MKFRLAWSLVELLIVVAILLALMGVLLPVLAASKASGHHAAEISALRQLGAAGQLYFQQHDEFPASALQVAAADPRLAPLITSKRDAYPGTIIQSAKRMFPEQENYLISPDARASFVGQGDIGPVMPHPSYHGRFYRYLRAVMIAFMNSSHTPGWLISFMPQMPSVKGNFFDYTFGPMDRLTYEGSVVKRPSCFLDDGPNHGIGRCFTDMSCEEYQRIIDEAERSTRES